jgi:hypothetical protein
MDVSAAGAELTFCCATGKIPPPLPLDASGHFDLTGMYSYQAGPVPVGGYPPEPAHYTGVVDGNTLTLNVTTPRFASQTYALTFGVHGPANCFCPL